ncbi:MAG: hypothetical protein HY791_14235 [Deltaproteobacteria bacterium]|nr:hypothetical protein [Deltaproteobacteria bacterium]
MRVRDGAGTSIARTEPLEVPPAQPPDEARVPLGPSPPRARASEAPPLREGLLGILSRPSVRAVAIGASGLAGLVGAAQSQAATVAPPTTVFLGMNPGASHESSELASRVQGQLRVLRPATQQDKIAINGRSFDLAQAPDRVAFGRALGLSAERAEALGKVLEQAGENAKDEVAQLAQTFRDAEAGRIQMSRLVLSGHSVGMGVWGDSNGTLTFDILGKLTQLFPRGAEQVKHLAFSACYTGGGSGVLKYQEIFPKLESVWAYDGSAPGSYSGAVPHLLRWENATREGATRLDRDLAKNTRKGENVAVWTKARGYDNGKPDAQLALVKASYEQSREVVERFRSGEESVSDPTQGPLRQHLDRIQGLLARTDLDADFRSTITTERELVVRLLGYKNIAGMFQTLNGAEIQLQFTAQNLPVPNFTTLSRKAALTTIAEYQAKLGESPAPRARALLEKLDKTLVELSPEAVPAGWIGAF